jgi:hypothetical protein
MYPVLAADLPARVCGLLRAHNPEVAGSNPAPAAAIRTFTGATMFLFEAFVSQKAKAAVADVAVHFASRDRSQIADQVIVPRLKVLGFI